MSYDKLFEGLSDALRMLQDAQSVVVVGNGPMSGNLGPQIEKVITSEETYTSTMALLCFSGCFLCICLIAILVRDICEGAPTNPDSLCLQLEHVVDCVSSGSGWG